MLSPRRVKFRKQQRGRMRGVATRGNTIAFGEFALQAQECGWITSRQIEASRRAMTRYVKRGGKIWIRIFPDKPVTMRPAETRMGSGKGNPEFWVAVIKPGRILFEMGGADITPEIAKEAMRLAQYKLPVKTKFLSLADQEAAERWRSVCTVSSWASLMRAALKRCGFSRRRVACSKRRVNSSRRASSIWVVMSPSESLRTSAMSGRAMVRTPRWWPPRQPGQRPDPRGTGTWSSGAACTAPGAWPP